MKDVPIVFLESCNPMSVMVFVNPHGLRNVWLRGPSGNIFQPHMGEGPA